MEVLINGKAQFVLDCTTSAELRSYLEKTLGLKPEEYYLLSDGKLVNDCNDTEYSRIHIVPRIFGGKGGFGSMLRAIGAQIEKTTNREACRDLSGRRLRDINEEQRLKNWINQQAEREKEAKDKKQKKLERLCEAPRHEFKDAQYDKERSQLPEMVEDALLHGLQASCSTKRKTTDKKPVVKKKKAKLWVDDELEDDLSSSGGEDDESDSEENKNLSGTKKNVESGNSSSSESSREFKKAVKGDIRTREANEEEMNTKMVEVENGSLKNIVLKKDETNEATEKMEETNENLENGSSKNEETNEGKENMEEINENLENDSSKNEDTNEGKEKMEEINEGKAKIAEN